MPNPYPAIPFPQTEVKSLQRTTLALKEAVELMAGHRGSESVASNAQLEEVRQLVTTAVTGPQGPSGAPGPTGPTGPAGSMSLSDVSFTQTGTGAVARTVDAKLKDIITLTDFNVDPTGATDSSAGVQAAVNAALAKAHGATIHIPAGTYKVAAQVSIPKTSGKFVTFQGDAGAQFLAASTLAVAMFYVGSSTAPGGGCNFTALGCVFAGQNTTTSRAFKLENANAAVFRDNVFLSMYQNVEMVSSYGVEFSGNEWDTCTSYAIYSSTSAHHMVLTGNKFYNTGTGGAYTILIDGATDNLVVRDNDAETGWCFLGLAAGGTALTFEGNYVEYFSNTPFFFNAAVTGASIRQNWLALSGALTLGNIAGGSYVNNSSYNQTVAVNGATVSDLEWAGNAHAGTGTMAYSGRALIGLANAANDAAAATAGVPVNGMYRNGSVLMVRVS